MANWDDIRAFMRQHYKLVEDREDGVALVVHFEDRRRQHISLTPCEALDRMWVIFETRICRKELLAPDEACRINAQLPVGSLAIDHTGFYIARHTALLETLDAEEIMIPLHALVTVADDLEERLTGDDLW